MPSPVEHQPQQAARGDDEEPGDGRLEIGALVAVDLHLVVLLRVDVVHVGSGRFVSRLQRAVFRHSAAHLSTSSKTCAETSLNIKSKTRNWSVLSKYSVLYLQKSTESVFVARFRCRRFYVLRLKVAIGLRGVIGDSKTRYGVGKKTSATCRYLKKLGKK